MIKSYMSQEELRDYLNCQLSQVEEAIKSLDITWKHAKIIEEYCLELSETIKKMLLNIDCNDTLHPYQFDRKKEKYTQWVEVFRLALFQYERFVSGGAALSEGLYATLVMLAATYNTIELNKIVILGCGPGRSVLDFSRLYPSCIIEGLDYSLQSLILANQILCGNNPVKLLRRNVYSSDYSEVLSVPGMNRKNVCLGLIDLSKNSIPRSDMIICSNVLNLLPDHKFAINQIYKSLNPGGLVIFADLLGWRLDREKERKGICTDSRIIELFSEVGFNTLESFCGVPYIESESADQFVLYKEHFYVGRKEICY